MSGKKVPLPVTLAAIGIAAHSLLFGGAVLAEQDRAIPAVKQTQSQTNGQSSLPVSGPAWKNLSYLISNSDMAFRGVVRDIQYKLADPAQAGQTKIPFTFVTYDVTEVLHGDFSGSQVVLRFIGGWDGTTERYMGASNVPEFDLNDEDILFVAGNNDSTSPLVMNDRGRFRVSGGKVYSNSGSAVTVDRNGSLRYGQRHNIPQILSTTVMSEKGAMLMQHNVGAAAPVAKSNAVSAGDMVAMIKDMGASVKSQANFTNANINAALTGPDMRPSAPPQAGNGDTASRQETPTGSVSVPAKR